MVVKWRFIQGQRQVCQHQISEEYGRSGDIYDVLELKRNIFTWIKTLCTITDLIITNLR